VSLQGTGGGTDSSLEAASSLEAEVLASVSVSVIAADGTTYALGQLVTTTTIRAVKHLLAERSELHPDEQSMYLVSRLCV
jgi:hypothetical protein